MGEWWRVRRGGGAGRLLARVRARGDAGMTTAEYAMGTIAACAFAVVLYRVVTSSAVRGTLQGLIEKALDVPF